MSARLRSDFWVAAYLRRCNGANRPAVLRRRGGDEAGAILIKVDRLDGTASLFGPAPQSEVEDRDAARSFVRRMHDPKDPYKIIKSMSIIEQVDPTPAFPEVHGRSLFFS